MFTPMLHIFAGLPGVGKTEIARRLAVHRRAACLRIDTIEQGLRDLCGINVAGEGYRLSYRIAADNLANGISVVADSCNPWELTRDEWQQVAIDTTAAFVHIEIVCSDVSEHRRRIESRTSDIDGLVLPDWEAVQARDYHDWTRERIVIDTAGKTVEESVEELLAKLETPAA